MDYWNAQAPNIQFIAQLGDLLDGQNAGKYGAGLKLSEPQSEIALEKLLVHIRRSLAPFHHALGNHELYNFSLEQLCARGLIAGPDCHYSLSPAPGWRVVMLNTYDAAMMHAPGSEARAFAEALIAQHNPQALTGSGDFFAGLVGPAQRFVPFNGGVREAQMAWLRETLASAHSHGEKVLVLTHVPLLSAAASHRTVALNCDTVLDALHEHDNLVVAVFAGHDHSGGYARDYKVPS